MDEFWRFALDAAVKDERAETECRALERYWIRWAGAPKVLRVDSSGGRMSQFMKDWRKLRIIRLSIVPRSAHHTHVRGAPPPSSPRAARDLQEGPPQ